MVRFVPQAATVGAIGMPSFEMVVEKLVQAVTCIVSCRAIVFQPMIKNHPAGLELRVIESMVRAGIDDKLDWWPVVAPAGNLVGTVCRRCPIVAGPNENERRYSRTRPRPPTWRIKRSRRPKPQVAWWFEQFERIGLRHREGNPGACREADHSHTVWIDEGLAAQEDQSSVGIRPAFGDGGKRTRYCRPDRYDA